MKKLFLVGVLLVIGCLATFAQPFYGPGYGTFPDSKNAIFSSSLALGPITYKWEGTLEYHDGLSFIVVGKETFYLIVPKKAGLVLNTKPGEGKKAEVWGYRYLSPINQLVVEYMTVDGKPVFDRTPTLLK